MPARRPGGILDALGVPHIRRCW